MQEFWALLRFGHLLAAVFMAAPLYALLAVNERGRFGSAIRFGSRGRGDPAIWALRRRRKQIAASCLFLVIGTVLLGLRLGTPFGVLLVLILLGLAAVFAWRVYRSLLPYGWF